jgi:hypothetical protein
MIENLVRARINKQMPRTAFGGTSETDQSTLQISNAGRKRHYDYQSEGMLSGTLLRQPPLQIV